MSFVINPGTVIPPLTAGGIAYGTGSQVKVNNAGTLGQLLQSNGASVPTWVTVTSTGTVSSVSWTGGIVAVATPTTTPAFTIAGTSGGIPYFDSSSSWASSSALTQYGIVYGGGAGTAPQATAAGTNGQVLTATTSGAPSWASGGFTTFQVFTSSGTFTIPAGVTKVKLYVTGGGGDGNSLYPQYLGAAGGTSIGYLTVVPANTITITVGAAGSNSAGGSSTAVYLTTTFTGSGGGYGGLNQLPSGGSGSGGQLNIIGGSGMGTSAGAPGFFASSFWGGYGAFGAGSAVYWAGGQAPVAPIKGVVVVEY